MRCNGCWQGRAIWGSWALEDWETIARHDGSSRCGTSLAGLLTQNRSHLVSRIKGWIGYVGMTTPRGGCLGPSLLWNLYLTTCSRPSDALPDCLQKGLGPISWRLNLALSDPPLESKQLVLALARHFPALTFQHVAFLCLTCYWAALFLCDSSLKCQKEYRYFFSYMTAFQYFEVITVFKRKMIP